MKRFVAETLRVEAGEWRKVAMFSLLGLLLQAGLGIGFSAGDALFLAKVGADKLPIIFILTPLVMLIYTPAFAWLTAKTSLGTVTRSMVCFLAAGGVIFFLLTRAPLPPPFDSGVFYGLKLYLAALYISLYTLFWLFVDSYFNVQDGKRLFPLFAAAGAVGTALGAALVGFGAGTIPTSAFFLVWSGLALVTLPLTVAIKRNWSELSESEDVACGDKPEGSLVRSFLSSRFAVLMALLLFSTLILTNLAEFQYSTILSQGVTEEQLAGRLGTLYAACNLFNIVVCLFVFNRLVARLGVRNVTLLMPATYLLTFVLLFLASSPVAACFAFWAYQGMLTSVEYNNQNLLFNALPSKMKGRLRTMIEGLCEPLASCLSGSFLLVTGESWGLRQVAGIAILVAAALMLIAVLLRATYPRAMAENMKLGWLTFSRSRAARPIGITEEAREALLRRACSPPCRAALEAMRLLVDQAPQAATSPLLEALATWPVVELAPIGPLLEQLLEASDASALPGMVAQLHRLAANGNPVARAVLARAGLLWPAKGPALDQAELVARWHAGTLEDKASISRALQASLQAADEEKLGALEQIGTLRLFDFRQEALDLLGHPNVMVGERACDALAEIAERGDMATIGRVLGLLPALHGTFRAAAIRVLLRIVQRDQVAHLLLGAEEFAPAERRALESGFVAQGPQTIPVLVDVVQDAAMAYAGKALAARTLSQLSFTHLEALHLSAIGGELRRLGERLGLVRALAGEAAPECRLLVRAHADAVRKGVEFVLELYALVGVLPDFDLVAASLRSANPKVRANALETIETCVGHKAFRTIRALTEGATEGDPAISHQAVEDALLFSVRTGNEVEAALAVEALRNRAPQLLRDVLGSRLQDGCGPVLAASVRRATGTAADSVVDQAIRHANIPGNQAVDSSTLFALAQHSRSTGEADEEARVRLAGRRADLSLALLSSRLRPVHA